MADPVDREIRLAFWKIHILHHAAIHAVYGLWMLDELAEHGHRLSPGTLYPIFARMEANDWLRAVGGSRSNKARKNYRATGQGRRVLGRLKKEIEALYNEVVREGPSLAHPARQRRTRSRWR